ncbi:MAG: hypothetical protein C5B59_06625 [Bacteroidetes bacterium]|nr:MAG: hypothetical protein C5B59_06625 [Bacteroidota bacterium]
MNFYEYIGIDEPTFRSAYLGTKYVTEQVHPEFPLSIFTYGRKTVHDNYWDEVTRKCRGIIVNQKTGEIVARPFEKFFNLGQHDMPDCQVYALEEMPQPVVWEKVDGFLCTLYRWEGKPYIASKGSFTSPHAKWATAWYRANVKDEWPIGYTPVFEGITPNLKIVVDYGKEEKLVLLGLIESETGYEYAPEAMEYYAELNGVTIPKVNKVSWQEAHSLSYTDVLNDEGFVLTWYYSFGAPFRLKLKYAEYLRLHRMVTGVSPKHVLEVLENGWTTEMEDLVNNGTPWFKKWVTKWKTVIENEYKRLRYDADLSYNYVSAKMHEKYKASGNFPARKDWAYEFNQHPELAPMLFARLDGKDLDRIIWKKIKDAPFMKGGHPMIDQHSL